MSAKEFFEELRSRNYHPGLVDNDILYLPRTGCIYVAISKNACSLIKSELYRVENGEMMDMECSPHDRKATGFLSPADMPEEHFYELLQDPGIPKFAMIREPFERFVSCYRNRVAAVGLEGYANVNSVRTAWVINRQKILAHNTGTRVSYQDAMLEEVTFTQFILYVYSEHPWAMDRHWYPQERALFLDMINYDYIGQIETFGDSLNRISELIDAPATYCYDGRRLNQSTGAKPDIILSQWEKHMLEAIYAEDFALLERVKRQYP